MCQQQQSHNAKNTHLGLWMQDAGERTQDTGRRMQDAGWQTQRHRNEVVKWSKDLQIWPQTFGQMESRTQWQLYRMFQQQQDESLHSSYVPTTAPPPPPPKNWNSASKKLPHRWSQRVAIHKKERISFAWVTLLRYRFFAAGNDVRGELLININNS